MQSLVKNEWSNIITIISILFSVWQYYQKKTIKKLFCMHALEVHNNISKVLGAIQTTRSELNNSNISSFEAGRAEGISQSILNGSARLYCNLKGTSISDIDKLIKNRQLNDQYKDIYYSYSDSKRKIFLF